MAEGGKRLVGPAPNVVVELLIGVGSPAAMKTLVEDGVAVDMTLTSSAPQTLLAVRAGTCYVSPFVGRVDDIGSDGVASLEETMRCIHNYDLGHECEIIATSIHSPYHAMAVALMGVDIATVSFGALKNCIKHPLMAEGLTKFETDRRKVESAWAGV